MNILNHAYCYSYKNREGNNIVFVICPEESDKKQVLTYNQFFDGQFTGNRYSITEILYLMDNGYDWKAVKE